MSPVVSLCFSWPCFGSPCLPLAPLVPMGFVVSLCFPLLSFVPPGFPSSPCGFPLFSFFPKSSPPSVTDMAKQAGTTGANFTIYVAAFRAKNTAQNTVPYSGRHGRYCALCALCTAALGPVELLAPWAGAGGAVKYTGRQARLLAHAVQVW